MTELKKGMRPFDLKKALAGDPVVTRDGHKVRHVYYYPQAKDNVKLVVWFDEGNAELYYENGELWENELNDLDLFMAPIRKQNNTSKELLYKKLNALRLEVNGSIVDDIKSTVDAIFQGELYCCNVNRPLHHPECCCEYNPTTDSEPLDVVLASNCCPIHNTNPIQCRCTIG